MTGTQTSIATSDDSSFASSSQKSRGGRRKANSAEPASASVNGRGNGKAARRQRAGKADVNGGSGVGGSGTATLAENSVPAYRVAPLQLAAAEGEVQHAPRAPLFAHDGGCVLRPLRSYVHQGAVHCMALSPSGDVLATGSTRGSICLWDARVGDHALLMELRDTRPEVFDRYIEEFLTCCFSPDEKCLLASGARRSRREWDYDEADCKVAASPIKIFDLTGDDSTGQVCAELDGHQEEVFRLQLYREHGDDGDWMMMSCSQDGTVILWRFADHGRTFSRATRERIIPLESMDVECLTDAYVASVSPSRPTAYETLQSLALQHGLSPNELNGEAYIATHCELLPRTRAQYALVSVDTGLCVLDLAAGCVAAKFPALFTAICDSFCVFAVEVPTTADRPGYFSVLVHGVESLVGEGRSSEQVRASRCLLCHLHYPTAREPRWRLEAVRELGAAAYVSNVWPTRVNVVAGGSVAVAGTERGSVVIWPLADPHAAPRVLADAHDAKCCVRQVLPHPHRPWLYSCCDDGTIQVWTTEREEAPSTQATNTS